MSTIIPFADFAKIELRVGSVTLAEPVPGSEKLLRLEVDFGEEKRQILAGIAKGCSPTELVGKQLVFVANLEPRMLMGLESQGMILAASDAEGKPVLLMPTRDVPAGSSIH